MRVSKRPPDTALAETFRGEPGTSAGIKKEYTLLKTEGEAATSGGYESRILRPTDKQLEKINRFTKSPKTAEEVVCFKTLSCNDLEDRDDDQFTTSCVHDFAKLPEPYSPVGKSYMVSHDYTKMPVGRIFDVGTSNMDGVSFLTNEVYMPNTEQHKNFIENVDYGIYWAVSVGVMLGADECKVCKSPFHWIGWWCKNGHEKGLYYDPESDETDDYGWPIPVDATAKNAVKCVRLFKEPKDFYELSQVFLGAQYYAALQRDPNFEGILKAASASSTPVIGLSASEAFHLPIPHSTINLGMGGFATMTLSGGNTNSWTDVHGLKWSVGPNGETVCHGKQTEEEDDGERSSDSGGERSGEEVGQAESGSVPGSEAVGAEVGSDGSQEVGGSGSEGSSVGSSENEEEEMDKQAVLAAAQQAKLPTSVLEQLAAAEDNGLLLVLQTVNEQLTEANKELEELRPKATLGEAYIKELRSEVINWYVKANQEDNRGVDTKNVEKLIDACGGNVELLKELQSQYEKTARSRFPAAVRRSISETDPNERSEFAEQGVEKVDTKSVRKLHG